LQIASRKVYVTYCFDKDIVEVKGFKSEAVTFYCICHCSVRMVQRAISLAATVYLRNKCGGGTAETNPSLVISRHTYQSPPLFPSPSPYAAATPQHTQRNTSNYEKSNKSQNKTIECYRRVWRLSITEVGWVSCFQPFHRTPTPFFTAFSNHLLTCLFESRILLLWWRQQKFGSSPPKLRCSAVRAPVACGQDEIRFCVSKIMDVDKVLTHSEHQLFCVHLRTPTFLSLEGNKEEKVEDDNNTDTNSLNLLRIHLRVADSSYKIAPLPFSEKKCYQGSLGTRADSGS